jgi:hypothetical protein
VQECPISHAENVVLEYLALEEGSKERELMELRFGKTIMKKLVNRYQEEQLNKQWLAASTMACAGCSVAVEKSLGCNHVCRIPLTAGCPSLYSPPESRCNAPAAKYIFATGAATNFRLLTRIHTFRRRGIPATASFLTLLARIISGSHLISPNKLTVYMYLSM